MQCDEIRLRPDDFKPYLILKRRFQGRKHQRTGHQVDQVEHQVTAQEEDEPRLWEYLRCSEQRLERRIFFFVKNLPLDEHFLRVREELAVHSHVVIAS